MIRQFTYTASPWGVSSPGWMVFQQSKGVSNDEIKSLYQSFKYEGVEAENVAYPPIQFVYQPGSDGKGIVLCQTAFTGMRWWGEPRPGDFFAHVLLVDEVALAVPDFNPFCLYRSPDLQTAFPEALKDKALKIYRHEIPHEKPPELSALTNFSEIRWNDSLRFDAVLKRVPDTAIQKLGTIVSGLLHRPDGYPFVFDCTCAGALDVWTLAFHLCPVEVRRHLWLAFGFSESALKRLPNYLKFTVYGTKRKNAVCDSTTGLYEWEKLPKGKLTFQTPHDVVRFKKMLDCCGVHLETSGFDRLVDCWRILSGDEQSVSLIKEASAFINEHRLVASVIREELMNQAYAGDDEKRVLREQLRCVARYELGLIEDITESCLEELLHGGVPLETMFDSLVGNALSKFLGDLYRYAQKQNALAELANAYLAVIAHGKCGSNVVNPFFQKVQLFARIREPKIVGVMERELNDLRALRDETGGRLEGLSNVMLRIQYTSGLAKLESIVGLRNFLAQYPISPTLPREKLEQDVLARLKPICVNMEVSDLCKRIQLLENAGLSGAHLLEYVLQKARQSVAEKTTRHVRSNEQGEEWERRIRCERIVGWLFGVFTVVILLAGWHVAKRWLASDKTTYLRIDQTSSGIVAPVNSTSVNKTSQKKDEVAKVIAKVVQSAKMSAGGTTTNHVAEMKVDHKSVPSNRLEKVGCEISRQGKKVSK